MMKCSGELDLMRKSEADSKLFPLTNKLVSSAFKNTGKNSLPKILHGESNLMPPSQELSTKLRKSQKSQKCYFMR
jgi:hypothetical protein